MKSCPVDNYCLYNAQGELTCNIKQKPNVVVAPNTVGKNMAPVPSPQKVVEVAVQKK